MFLAGAIPRAAFYAGHSLGEYSAIGCLVKGLSVPQLAEVRWIESDFVADWAFRCRLSSCAV